MTAGDRRYISSHSATDAKAGRCRRTCGGAVFSHRRSLHMFPFHSNRSAKLRHGKPSTRQPAGCRPRLEALESRDTPTPFSFNNGTPDGLMATASRPGSTTEIESGDDFALATETQITSATITGLVPKNFK